MENNNALSKYALDLLNTSGVSTEGLSVDKKKKKHHSKEKYGSSDEESKTSPDKHKPKMSEEEI